MNLDDFPVTATIGVVCPEIKAFSVEVEARDPGSKMLLGLTILHKYEPAVHTVIRGNTLMCGDYPYIHARMTRAERELMTAWGWIPEEGTWAFRP